MVFCGFDDGDGDVDVFFFFSILSSIRYDLW